MIGIPRPSRTRRALVTRPREAAERLAAALAERAVDALMEPLTTIRFREVAPLDLAGVQAILCTSANGVRALARASGERRLRLFAVGEATAAAARAAGFAAVESAGGDAAALARLTAARLQPAGGRLVHIAGTAVAGDLAGDLAARGFAVERLILYEAQPAARLSEAARDALSGGTLDFALFFSPRTAAIFARLAAEAGVVADCRPIVALSISRAADAALAALPWRARHVAATPDQRSLLDLIDGARGAEKENA